MECPTTTLSGSCPTALLNFAFCPTHQSLQSCHVSLRAFFSPQVVVHLQTTQQTQQLPPPERAKHISPSMIPALVSVPYPPEFLWNANFDCSQQIMQLMERSSTHTVGSQWSQQPTMKMTLALKLRSIASLSWTWWTHQVRTLRTIFTPLSLYPAELSQLPTQLTAPTSFLRWRSMSTFETILRHSISGLSFLPLPLHAFWWNFVGAGSTGPAASAGRIQWDQHTGQLCWSAAISLVKIQHLYKLKLKQCTS